MSRVNPPHGKSRIQILVKKNITHIIIKYFVNLVNEKYIIKQVKSQLFDR